MQLPSHTAVAQSSIQAYLAPQHEEWILTKKMAKRTVMRGRSSGSMPVLLLGWGGGVAVGAFKLSDGKP